MIANHSYNINQLLVVVSCLINLVDLVNDHLLLTKYIIYMLLFWYPGNLRECRDYRDKIIRDSLFQDDMAIGMDGLTCTENPIINGTPSESVGVASEALMLPYSGECL